METQTNRAPDKDRKAGNWLWISFAVCTTYFLVSINLNVYSIAVLGAVYEIIWLPVILLIFTMPLISFVFWARNKFSLKSGFLLLFVLSLTLLTVSILAR
jgi:hypothetical protein